MIHEIKRDRTVMRCSCGFFVDMMTDGNPAIRLRQHIDKFRSTTILRSTPPFEAGGE